MVAWAQGSMYHTYLHTCKIGAIFYGWEGLAWLGFSKKGG